ncbi:MAG: putative Ig domain-containing protein, partial [Pirellulales bacterium]|nr:putative Ig domain-containing protein [Pirellulales bacterium]
MTFHFDPDFVDDNGDIITRGAQLVDSGRAGMQSDRLVWDPPQVTQPTDFQFRVIVRDSAGQIGRKDWTVTVYPENESNTLPTIITTDLGIDPDHSDGLVGEPVLPSAKELRSYRYQVIAADEDPQDQDNLRYYLAPTTLNGQEVPVPQWLNIDRNTGLLTGRPGSQDVGSTHVTVVVSDGRFVRDAGQVLASKTQQVFAITIGPRDELNTPPTITPIDDLVVRIGEQVNIPVTAFDADNHDLQFELHTAPKGMFIDPVSGVISWVPTAEQIDVFYPVTVSVTDGRTSTNESFTIFVVRENRPPIITTELEDWVTYANYRQRLTAADPDGDVVVFNVAVGVAGMSLGYDNDEFYLHWTHDQIIPGRHLIRLRAFDGAGGVAERDYYVNFEEFTAPQFVEIQQPTWREGSQHSAWVHVSSQQRILDWAQFARDQQSTDAGMVIDTAGIQETSFAPFEDHWGYFIPIRWTPQHAGSYDVSLTATNGNGTMTEEFIFAVNPFVIESENNAPIFADRVLGPFAKGRQAHVPLEVTDPEGHPFTVTSVIGGGTVVDGALQFLEAEPGIYYVTLQATEDLDPRVTMPTSSHPIAVDDGATGTGWIMYSSRNLHERFADKPPSVDSSEHFIVVRLDSGRWEYNDDSTNWHGFTPRADDLLVAAVDFDANTTTPLQGQFGRERGIAYGYVSGNLTFQADSWNSALDPGEFTVSGDEFEIKTDSRVITPTSSHPIGVDDGATGTGWIMYSSQDLQERFSDNPPAGGSSEHFIVVRLDSGHWEYNDDSASWHRFNPRADDMLVAAVDFDANTTTSLEGQSGRERGVAYGYVSGNLTFQADSWNGTFNPGEFTVTGDEFVITAAKSRQKTYAIAVT